MQMPLAEFCNTLQHSQCAFPCCWNVFLHTKVALWSFLWDAWPETQQPRSNILQPPQLRLWSSDWNFTIKSLNFLLTLVIPIHWFYRELLIWNLLLLMQEAEQYNAVNLGGLFLSHCRFRIHFKTNKAFLDWRKVGRCKLDSSQHFIQHH